MKKIHFFCLNMLLFVMSAQMLVYHVGFIFLGLLVVIVTVTEVPDIDLVNKESMLLLLPMTVSVGGLTWGLFVNFYRNNYLMENYCYCLLTAIISYLAGIGCLVFYRKYLSSVSEMVSGLTGAH